MSLDISLGDALRRLANRTAHLVARFPCELNCYVDFIFLCILHVKCWSPWCMM